MKKLSFFFFLFVVTLSRAASHHPQDFLHKIAGSKKEGEQLVQHYCANCHAKNPLIQLGAPRIGELSDWKPRVKNGYDVLFQHTDEGINAMPQRGGCFECTDQQLFLAILYMLPNELRNSFLKDQNIHKKINL